MDVGFTVIFRQAVITNQMPGDTCPNNFRFFKFEKYRFVVSHERILFEMQFSEAKL
jgi:hypothetical protein